jgi:hypothetical protein
MNRLISGLVLPIALLGVAACNTEPTDDLRTGAQKLFAAPTQLFLDLGRTKTVEIGAVDAQGNPIEAEYLITDVGSGIGVVRDLTFQPVFGNDSVLVAPRTAPRFRFIVTAKAFGKTSFTVEGAGQSITVPVQVIPNTDFPATFSNENPALGDTIVLTAAPGTKFSASSVVTTGDTINPPRTLSVAADGSTISFLLPPNLNGPVSVTDVTADAAPTLKFTPATVSAIHTPVYDSVDVSFSNPTPGLGASVTATITDNPLVNFDAAADLHFVGELPGPAAGPQNVTVAADSNSLTFDAPPNANGPATVTSFVFPGDYLIALPTRASITGAFIGDSLAATFDNPTPDLLQNVTLTAPAGFKFDVAANDTVSFTGQNAIIQSVAGDGSSITLLPLPGSTGPGVITGVFPTAATQFSLTMPTKQAITVPPLEPLPGTDKISTAPTLSIPSTTVDAGTFAAADCGQNTGSACQLYKIVLPADVTLHVRLEGFGSPADLGLYFINPDGTDAAQSCDILGNFSPPEDCNLDFTAGTYIMAVISFGPEYPTPDPNPPFFKVTVE